MDLKDELLVRTFLVAHFRRWSELIAHVRQCNAHGVTPEELRMTLRFLVVSSGYGPCLGAFTALKDAGLLPAQTPGKVGGPPSRAFEVVYEGIASRVRKVVHSSDAVLGNWIQRHLYGDVFASPGISLRLKELLMVTFLAEAHMPSQLYGHCRAAFRFGNSPHAVQRAITLGFEYAPRVHRPALQDATDTAWAAWAAFRRETGGQGAAPCAASDGTDLTPAAFLLVPDTPRDDDAGQLQATTEHPQPTSTHISQLSATTDMGAALDLNDRLSGASDIVSPIADSHAHSTLAAVLAGLTTGRTMSRRWSLGERRSVSGAAAMAMLGSRSRVVGSTAFAGVAALAPLPLDKRPSTRRGSLVDGARGGVGAIAGLGWRRRYHSETPHVGAAAA